MCVFHLCAVCMCARPRLPYNLFKPQPVLISLSLPAYVFVCVCVFDEEAELEGLDAFKGMMSSAGSRLKVRHYLI